MDAIVTKHLVSSQYIGALNNRCEKKQRNKNIDIYAREKQLEKQMTLSETSKKRDQRLMRTKKNFVKRLTQKRMQK